MQIRPATDADLPILLKLYAGLELDADYRPSLSLEEAGKIWQRMRSYPDYRIYISEVEGEVVGTFALLIMDNLEHDGKPSGIIEAVSVDPAWRSQGIGKTMMIFALDRCREKGCCKVTLSSNLRRERAHRFYESLGFEKHGYSFTMNLEAPLLRE